MQPVLRKVSEKLRADLQTLQAQRFQPRGRRLASAFMAAIVLLGAVVAGAVPGVTTAANTNVIANGGFESGFGSQPGCGSVGNGWNCFTNGGAVQFAYHDDQWDASVAEGDHSQLISLSTKGLSQADADRYAGIYQTVRVVEWQQYTLNLQGLIRSTQLDGDPYRYVVEVGHTFGPHPNWAAVTNWHDVGWYTYYEREAPGPFSSYARALTAEDDYVTIYIRVWKKWGVPEVELDVNLDGISLTGPAPYYAPNTGGGVLPIAAPVPAAAPAVAPVPAAQAGTCAGGEFIYNGGFELGFNSVYVGNVGKGWGFFTNGGAANFGYYNDQWARVVAEGGSSQLIEINTVGRWPADQDRFAGIYQHIGRLTPGVTYEFTVRGLLRGQGGSDDPYRYEAQWGFNAYGNTDWTKVTNWQGMDLGPIYPKTDPGQIGTFRVRFTAPSSSIVLFLRGWSKWPVSEQEMLLNLDGLSLRGCTGGPGPGPIPNPPDSCIYIVRPGDTLGRIARQYNTTVYQLATLNRIANPNIIFVGQQLIIPGCTNPNPPHPPQPPQPPVVQYYTVQRGDTLSGIARRFGVSTADLAYCNGIRNWNLIFVGQVLMIP